MFPPSPQVRHKEIDKTIVVIVAPCAANREAAIVDDSAGGDLGEGGIDIRCATWLVDGARGISHNDGIIADVGELHVGQNQAAIPRIEDIRGIETPRISERTGACSRDLERYVCP